MILISILGAVGLFLIFLEFFLPGAIFAIIGSCLVIASLTLFTMDAGAGWGIVYFVVLTLLVIGVCRLALWRIRNSKANDDFYLDQDQQGFMAASFDETVIGKAGVVLTELKPAGHISIEGKQYQALSEAGFISKGEPVVVVGGKGSHLIIRRNK